MQINKVAVIGAGTMGSAIAFTLIQSGLKVVLKDTNEEFLAKGVKNIEKILDKKIAKGLEPLKAQAIKNLLSTTTSYSDLADIDIAIEAVNESIDIKRQVFQELDEWCNVDAILTTNTSSLSITQIASFTRRSDKVCGLHFFNPAHIMKLVEIIPGLDTSSQTIATVSQLVNLINKTSVIVEECPSFLVNRLLTRYMNSSLWCLDSARYTIEQIDKAATDIAMPIGPLALRDMNGCDIGLAVAKYNFKEYGLRFQYPELLQKMVDNNFLGKKTNIGFYKYQDQNEKIPNEKIYELRSSNSKTDNLNIDLGLRLLLPMINEAFIVISEKICNLDSIDLALKTGLGMRMGPIEIATNIGFKQCLDYLEALQELYGESYKPSYLLKKLVYANKSSLN